MPEVNAPIALRVREVAAAIGVSKAFAYRLIADGRLPSVTIGNARRVLRSDLEAFLLSNRVGGDVK